MRPRKAVLSLVAVSALTLAAGMSPAAGQAGKDDSGGGQLTGTERRAAAIEAAGQKAAELAESRGALGAYYDESRGQHVVVVPRGAGLSGDAVSRSIGAAARVEQRDVTRGAVEGFHARLGGRSFHADAAGYTYAAYYDLMAGKLVVETDAPDSVVAGLTDGFPGPVDVRPGTITEDYSRQADIAPFWGGAAIKNSAGVVCSSGFVVKKSSGTRYMTTAGHCYGLGTNVLTRAGNISMGSVVQRAAISSRDMELIGGKSYGRSVYVGGTNSTTGKVVTGAANPVVGTTGYCRSGQTTGEKCGQRVTSITASFCPSSGCKYGVIRYDTGGASSGGDSGAPFYWPSSSSVSIRGLHVGRNTATGAMYAEKWSTISATLGVSIVT